MSRSNPFHDFVSSNFTMIEKKHPYQKRLQTTVFIVNFARAHTHKSINQFSTYYFCGLLLAYYGEEYALIFFFLNYTHSK